jgi:hypothetical protein
MIIAEGPLASGVDAVVAEARFNIDEPGLLEPLMNVFNFLWEIITR